VGRPLWREDGSVFCICCWSLPAQSFSGPSFLGVAIIFYSLRVEISIFVASYDSQGHGGAVRPRLHTGFRCPRTPWPLYRLRTNHIENTSHSCSVLFTRYPATSCLSRIYLRGNLFPEPLPSNVTPYYNIKNYIWALNRLRALSITTMKPSKLAQTVTFLARFRQVARLNLGRSQSTVTESWHSFLPSFQANGGITPRLWLRSLPSTPCPIRYSLISLPLDAPQCGLPTASLNETESRKPDDELYWQPAPNFTSSVQNCLADRYQRLGGI
jgi:hypothetical protein